MFGGLVSGCRSTIYCLVCLTNRSKRSSQERRAWGSDGRTASATIIAGHWRVGAGVVNHRWGGIGHSQLRQSHASRYGNQDGSRSDVLYGRSEDAAKRVGEDRRVLQADAFEHQIGSRRFLCLRTNRDTALPNKLDVFQDRWRVYFRSRFRNGIEGRP